MVENSSLAHQKLQPPIMKKLLIFLTVLFTNLSLAQSKKEQIAELQSRIDSLNTVLISERNANNQRIQELLTNISGLEGKIASLNKELTELKKELSTSKVTAQQLQNRMNELTNRLKSKSDSLEILRMEADERNLKIELITAPSFALSKSDIIKLVDSKMVEACPEQNILGETGPNICKKELTRFQYFKKGSVTRLFANIGYSYDGAHFDSGQDGFILAEYANSKWTIIDFLQFQHEGCWGNSLDFEEQFLLGENALGFYAETCGTGQGFTVCNAYIIGVVDKKIAVFLNEKSGENNLASGEKTIVNWEYKYSTVRSNNQVYSLQRELYKMDRLVSKSILTFKPELMKYE